MKSQRAIQHCYGYLLLTKKYEELKFILPFLEELVYKEFPKRSENLIKKDISDIDIKTLLDFLNIKFDLSDTEINDMSERIKKLIETIKSYQSGKKPL